jgi:hypothetical protein
MSYESELYMNGEQAMSMVATEVLREREQFFKPVDLHEAMTGCGDDRPIVGADLHIGIFGGVAANVAASLLALQEMAQPGSVTTSYTEASAGLVPVLHEKKIRSSVHSDQKTEAGDSFDPTEANEGDVGCAYLKLRQAIYQSAETNGDKAITILKREKPSVYDTQEGNERLATVKDAFVRLGSNNELFTTGRATARASVEKGAEAIVVEGAHDPAAVGTVNEKSGTTLDTREARDNGKPTYNQNAWAAREAFDEVSNIYPYDKRDFEASNDFDTILTMLALGIDEKDIAFRR